MTSVNAANIDDPVLSVSFDADQIGHRLVWFVDDGTRNVMQQWGPHAGSLHFPKPPYDLWVHVKAYGSALTFLGVEIQDAAIISIPRIYDPTTRAASPFESNSGCTPVTGFETVEPIHQDPVSGRNLMRLASIVPLRVREDDGAWKLSMVLTVKIYRKLASQSETRVFSFDPEAEVGNGSRPNA